MNDFHGSDRPHGAPAGDGAPEQPADGYGFPPGYPPPAAGWGDNAPGGHPGAPDPQAYAPEAPDRGPHAQTGYGQSGYAQDAYGHDAYAQGTYAQGTYTQDGYAQDPYVQNGYGRPAYGRSGHEQSWQVPPGQDGTGFDRSAPGGHAPSGDDRGGSADYAQGAGPQGGAAPGGRHGSGHVSGAAGGAGYAQDGYVQGGYPRFGDPHSGVGPGGVGPGGPAGYGRPADGTAYVPEPIAAQLPSDVEPGAGFGVPAAGDTWGGPPPVEQVPAAPPAADAWAAAPAPAPAWGTSPGGAPGYAPGQDAGPEQGPGYGRRPAPAPSHAPGRTVGAGQSVPASAPAASAPAGYAPAGYAPAGSGAEPELERTAALPVIEAQEAGAPRRTGSPIIPPGIQPAGLTAVLGLLVAGAAAVGRPGLAVVLVVLEAVTAAGWFRLNGMWPARQGIALAFLSGVTADIAVLAVDGGHGPVALLGTLGGWLLLVLVLQLRHHGSADERLSSLTATSASTLLTVVAAGYLLTATSHAGTDPVVVGAIAVAAATLVRAVRLPGGEPVSLVASLAVAAVTGALTGPATGFGTGHAVLLAAAAGACALIGLRVASYDWPSRFVHFTAGVALPLTMAAPAVYALGVALT